MNKIKSFIKTTLLGGALVVLPIVILILVFKWLYEFMADKIEPLTYIISETAMLQEFYSSLLAVIIILLIFFLVGISVKTRLGKYSFNYLEKQFFIRLPLYKLIKETTFQLVGSEKTLFKYVALVKLFANDTRVTAFITEEHEDGSYTVFVPSAPAPTAGFIYHLPRDKVQIINYPVDKAMKTILSFGAGSKELLNSYNSK
ncbi:MAG: DUF502 domain-containing protein [Ignavibacteriaceae bacterium]